MRRHLIIGSFLKQALQLIRKGEGTLHLFIWIDKWIVLLFTCTCFIEMCLPMVLVLCVHVCFHLYKIYNVYMLHLCILLSQILWLIWQSNYIINSYFKFPSIRLNRTCIFCMCWCGLLYSLSKLIYVFVKILQVFI